MAKKITRIVSFILSMLLLISVISACGSATTLMPFIAEDADKLNLDGYVFSFMQTDGNYENVFGYKATTVLSDAVLKRMSDIEQELNCKIEVGKNAYGADILLSKYMGGNLGFEAMYSTNNNQALIDAASCHILLPIEEYGDYIDYLNTEKYGDVNIAEINSYQGSIYGVTPIQWVHNEPVCIGLVVFNMGLVEQYGKTAPRELYENEKWTWDSFEHIVADYCVLDGENKIYSLAARSLDVLKLAALGNGVKYADIDADGSTMKTILSDNMAEACSWYFDLATNYAENFALSMTTADFSWAHVSEHFSTLQDTMVCVTAPNVLFGTIVYEVEKYSILPFPTGPRGEYGEWPSVLEGASTFSVFGTAKEPEIAFKIIDMLSEPFDGYETKEKVIDYIATNVLYSREDTEIVLDLKYNGQYTYWTQGTGFIGTFYRDLVNESLRITSAGVIEANKTKLATYLEDYVVPNIDIYKLYE